MLQETCYFKVLATWPLRMKWILPQRTYRKHLLWNVYCVRIESFLLPSASQPSELLPCDQTGNESLKPLTSYPVKPSYITSFKWQGLAAAVHINRFKMVCVRQGNDSKCFTRWEAPVFTQNNLITVFLAKHPIQTSADSPSWQSKLFRTGDLH